ncbi:hypothetical protein D8T40_16275 [Vibrio vulnificus]|nr:hypothetical protein D8T40_16275 [Vibrio vulnificus]
MVSLSRNKLKDQNMLAKQNLIKLARIQMPFGKYAGRVLIDLPEEYLLWFARKDEFPQGELGELMQLCLALKIEGLDSVVKPLKREFD